MDSVASEGDFIGCLVAQGQGVDAIRAELAALGWHESSIEAALSRFEHGPAAQPTGRAPGPDLSRLPTRIDAGDRTVAVLARMHAPSLCLLGDFVSARECEELIALAGPRMQRSRVLLGDGSANDQGVVGYARTSDQAFIERGESALVDALRLRAAQLTRWPATQMEHLQVVRYGPGADFSPHHDFFCPKYQGDIIERKGQRVGTLLFYLNTPAGGGATALLDVELEICPQQGNALFFTYPTADADSLTLHAGVPMGEGEKWIATFFLTDREPQPAAPTGSGDA
jgi:prolyl 4-hydroxylase